MVTKILTQQTPIINVPSRKLQLSKRLAKKINMEYDILKSYNNWYKIEYDLYYYKTTHSITRFINELINEQISNHFGIKNIQVYIGKQKQRNQINYGTLSKNFREPNKQYLSCKELQLTATNNLTGINQLKRLNGNTTQLIKDIKKLMIRDFFTNEIDREAPSNLLIEKNESQYQLAPLFDNEFSLLFNERPMVSSEYRNYIATLDITDPGTQNLLKTDPIYQEAINKVFTYSIKNDLEKIQDTLHLNLPNSYMAKYQHVIRIKKKMITKHLK